MAGMTANIFYGSSRQKHGQGRMSILRAERLLNAIANDSEIEDLSDGEEDDPAVGEIAPCEATVEQPDDSDSDYQPDVADISEDTDSDVSEPQHKQQHLENDEPDQDVQGRRAGPRNGNREYWKSAPFNPVLVPFQGADEQDERADMSPGQYMEQYVDIELMKVLADCTNSMSLAKSGRSLNTSVEEMYHFFGASILMSCIPYPQIRMFWSTNLRVPAISDTMRRDRFFKLRSHLKVVIDDNIPEDRKTDKFWKVRPFMNRILKGCHAQARPESVSIDEQMIPFTGGCPFRQYVPLKPNPVGMKNFVLATADGIVLDFEVYQGSKELAAQVLDAEGLGLGALVLKRLTKTVHPGTKVYCDRFFTTTSAAESMLEKQYCSDSEDLFGEYDSILEDSSLLAKLDDVEQNERLRAANQLDFTNLQSKQSCENALTDSILDEFRNEPFEDLPASQLHFYEQTKRSRLQDENKTFTPHQNGSRMVEAGREGETKRHSKARRSMADLLKRTMLGNAAAPLGVSRTDVLKEAVVSEEISVAMQAMETISADTTDLGPFFGLPSKVKELMHKLRGIQNLYDWQEMCLNLDCVQQRKNLIYSLPTSGGKTLVAEILILRELLCRKKDCLLILPYISLVQEKVRGLAGFGLELDFMVEEYAGSKGKFPPVKRRNKRSLYVATIEKAHSLVNSLIETSRLENLGLVVVDELHMLGDGSRGAVIEMTLAKVQYMSKTTQIVGMSATLGNIKDLQTFLRAENYTNDFRPVQLKEYVKVNDTIYEVDPKEENCFRYSRSLNFKYSSTMQKTDPDHIIALVTEVIPTHSCLIFCPTKKNCENVAGMICRYLKEQFLQHRQDKKTILLQELKVSGNGSVCPVLRKTVPYGVAYHHSGLTSEERKLVEEAYSNGVLCLLACTSTLAAGINLPARRVILRSPYLATDLLKRSQYKQMVGRAGRAGIDTVGESILILQEKDKNMAKTLVCAPVENCYSNLMHDEGKGVLSLILSLIGLNITTSLQQIQEFLRGTLLFVQQQQLCTEKSLWEVVQQCVDTLKEKDLITINSTDSLSPTLQITQLGRAAYKGSVDLTYCDVLYKDLSKGLEGLLLNSNLHLVYLVTPYDLIPQCKPDWMIYFRQFTLLSAAEQKMSAAVGVPESFVARKAAGQTVKKNTNLGVVRRMYLALVLFSLLKETDVWSVAERFQLNRGFIQMLLSSASAFCSCVLHFTEELEEFWPFRALLTELTRRLSYCVKAELIPLMEVAGVMESRAKQLYNAGYKTLAHLANADPAVLCRTIENLYKKQANLMVASAKMLLNEKAAALQEEVDELLTLPDDLPQL